MDGFIMENPIKMDDLGVQLFSETPIYCINRYQFDELTEVTSFSFVSFGTFLGGFGYSRFDKISWMSRYDEKSDELGTYKYIKGKDLSTPQAGSCNPLADACIFLDQAWKREKAVMVIQLTTNTLVPWLWQSQGMPLVEICNVKLDSVEWRWINQRKDVICSHHWAIPPSFTACWL